MTLYCATGNPGKLREFRLATDGTGVELELLPNYRNLPECEENGRTFEENAVIKAMHYAPHSPGPLFADDSGLEVDALSGAPGVYSARFSAPNATDARNNALLLEKLRGVPNRTARFVCAIALVIPGGVAFPEGGDPAPSGGPRLAGTWRGAVEGRIIDEPRGSGGFGYDPLFYYPPFQCTFGEAGAEQKLAVSHRGQAMRAMLASLRR